MKPLLAYFLLLLVAGAPLRGEEPPKTIGATLQFVADVEAVQPGVPFTIALHIKHDKHYHTYWKYPGIVGLSTMIGWKLPPGFSAGEIEWPTPEVVDMSTHPAHGFHRDVLLPVKITPPAQIKEDSLTFLGELAWMACHKACHPGFQDRSITLPVNRDSKARPNQRWSAAIAEERSNLPRPSDLWKVAVESKMDASSIVIRVRPRKGASTEAGEIYFFSEDGQVTSEPPQKVERQSDGSYLITATRSPFSPKKKQSLPGILVASKSWAANTELLAFRAEPSYRPANPTAPK